MSTSIEVEGIELMHSSDQTIATDNTTCEPLEPLTEMELFALDEDSECLSLATMSSTSPAKFNSLDACLDAYLWRKPSRANAYMAPGNVNELACLLQI